MWAQHKRYVVVSNSQSNCVIFFLALKINEFSYGCAASAADKRTARRLIHLLLTVKFTKEKKGMETLQLLLIGIEDAGRCCHYIIMYVVSCCVYAKFSSLFLSYSSRIFIVHLSTFVFRNNIFFNGLLVLVGIVLNPWALLALGV